MFKKIELWIVALLCVLFMIILIGFGAVLKDYYQHNQNKFGIITKFAVFISEIPSNLSFTRALFLDPGFELSSFSKKHQNKARFTRYINTERNELLLLARYDGDLKRSLVEIIRLNDFSVLHSYKPNINEINNKADTNKKEFKRLKTDDSPKRFELRNPLILNNGSIVSHSGYSPLFKIDFCSKILWVNDDDKFHHSNTIDHEGNYWVSTQMYPYSKAIQNYKKIYGFLDDAITKISPEGKILYQKSVSEIMLENNLLTINDLDSNDPIHLNDIEPVIRNGLYWKKGDVILSIRNLSLILHYRPSTNNIIRLIKGPFSMQHDVDIISENEISIFNNNVNYTVSGKKNENAEVLIYNLLNQSFSKKFNQQLLINDFVTPTQGLADILEDGSMMVEEQNYGRIMFFNSFGELEWEFVNKSSDEKIYVVTWSSIIKDKGDIKNINNIINNTKCKK